VLALLTWPTSSPGTPRQAASYAQSGGTSLFRPLRFGVVSSSTFDDSGWPVHVRRIEAASVKTLLNRDHVVSEAYGPRLGLLKLAVTLASDFIFVYYARCCRPVRGNSGAINIVNPEA
jgi:hypothetical protein